MAKISGFFEKIFVSFDWIVLGLHLTIKIFQLGRPNIKTAFKSGLMDTSLQSPITSIDSDECGHKVAVSLENGSIILLSTQNLRQLQEISIKDTTPNSVDFSNDKFGPLLAVGCSDGTVRLFSGNSEVRRFTNQKGSILSVAFHPSKCILAAASLDGTFSICAQKNQTGKNEWSETVVEASQMGLTAITWGPDGGSDMFLNVLVGGTDGVVRRFCTTGNKWEQCCAAQVHNGWVRSLASPNNPLASTFKAASCGDDSVYVLKIINNENIEKTQIAPLDTPVNGVAWAMVDKTLVLSHKNEQTTMWAENENGEWTQTSSN